MPLLARGIGAAGKIHVPELAMDELARMKVKADQPPAVTGHLLVELAKLGLAFFDVGPVAIGPELRSLFSVENI